MKTPETACILLAAGSGVRFGEKNNKLFTSICGYPVLFYSLKLLLSIKKMSTICLVVKDGAERTWIEEHILPLLTFTQRIIWCYGGNERQVSVKNGLLALADVAPQYVIIHDAARLVVHRESLSLLMTAMYQYGSASLARRVSDTLQRWPKAPQLDVLQPVNRENVWHIETPQGFNYALIYEAHMNAVAGFTDETTLLSSLTKPVYLVENPWPNPKLTIKNDCDYIMYLIKNNKI